MSVVSRPAGIVVHVHKCNLFCTHIQVQPITVGSTKLKGCLKVCAAGLVLPEYFLALGRKLLVSPLELTALTLKGCSRQLLKSCSQTTCIVQPHGYSLYCNLHIFISAGKVLNQSRQWVLQNEHGTIIKDGVELGTFSSWLKFPDRKLNNLIHCWLWWFSVIIQW